MRVRKIISKPLHVEEENLKAEGSVNAVVAANVNEPGASGASVSSRQRIVQRSRRRARARSNHEKGAM